MGIVPTKCPLGKYSNIGIPPYVYGWEANWELEKEAIRLMEINPYLSYVEAMISAENSPPRSHNRFWESRATAPEDFPQRSFRIVQGLNGGFSGGKRVVLLKKNHSSK